VHECKSLVAGLPGVYTSRGLRPRQRPRGRAVPVDPLKPKLKAPGSKRWKLQCDQLLSSFAFNCNMRRYSVSSSPHLDFVRKNFQYKVMPFGELLAALVAGAYTRTLFSST